MNTQPLEPTLLEFRSYLEERRNFHLNVFSAASELSPSQLIANLDALEYVNTAESQLVAFLNKSVFSNISVTY